MTEITQSDRFESWLNALDETCWQEMGISYQDLPAQPYRHWFDDGLLPEDAYYKLIETAYPGLEVPDIYYQEFDTFTDADPGL